MHGLLRLETWLGSAGSTVSLGLLQEFCKLKIPVKAQGPQANTKKISSVYYQNLLVPLGQKIKFHRQLISSN